MELVEQQREEWYVFDMLAEYIDPRFLYWLEENGIIVKINTDNRRGIIANRKAMLPHIDLQFIHSKYSIYNPASISIPLGELIPDIGKVIDDYDSNIVAPENLIYNPIKSNYGRPSREIIIRYLLNRLSTINEKIAQIEECDRQGLDEEFLEQINSIVMAVGKLEIALEYAGG